MFSDAFSEGQSRDISKGFPTGSSTTEVYDYMSDSDLEDECSCSEEEDAESTEGDNPELSVSPRAQYLGPYTLTTAPSEQSLTDASEAQDGNRLASAPPGPCKLFG